MSNQAGLSKSHIQVVPATSERWSDLETLFGPSGAFTGCWCMFWRRERSDFKKFKGEGNRLELKRMVEYNEIPGVLAYEGNAPIGWCSIGPRENYLALENSRLLKRVDDKPVWSIVCFFVTKAHREHGVMLQLVLGAVDYAREKGASIIEAYPIDMHSPKLEGQQLSSYAGYMGMASVFHEAGFKEITNVSETQRVMRLTIY